MADGSRSLEQSALLRAAARRTEIAAQSLAQHGITAAAGGRRLGLVPSSTSDTRRVSFTLDTNRNDHR